MTKQSQIRRNVLPDNILNGKNGHNFKIFDYILGCLALHNTKYIGKKGGSVALLFNFSPFFGFFWLF